MIDSGFLTIIFGALGFSHYIDKVMRETEREKIHNYVTGLEFSTFRGFETTIIDVCVGIFLVKKNVISFPRVCLYSLSCGVLFTAVVLISTPILEGAEGFFGGLALVISLVLMTAYMSAPSDYFSLFVTKKIFYKKSRAPVLLLPLWISDLILSLVVPAVPALAVIFALEGARDTSSLSDGSEFFIMGIGLGVSTLMSSFLSVFQFLLISIGLVYRYALSPVLNLIPKSFHVTSSREYPLTVLMLVLVSLIFVARLIIGI